MALAGLRKELEKRRSHHGGITPATGATVCYTIFGKGEGERELRKQVGKRETISNGSQMPLPHCATERDSEKWGEAQETASGTTIVWRGKARRKGSIREPDEGSSFEHG